MSFMYLHLTWGEKRQLAPGTLYEGVYAKVTNDGAIKTVGTENSRWGSPFAVFQLNGFEGLDYIGSEYLWAELEGRTTWKEIKNKVINELSNEELSAILAERLKGRVF